MSSKNEIFNTIKDRVYRKGMTVEMVENEIGVVPGYLNSLNKDDLLNPSSHLIEMIAKILQCSSEDLCQPVRAITQEDRRSQSFLKKVIEETKSGKMKWSVDDKSESTHPLLEYVELKIGNGTEKWSYHPHIYFNSDFVQARDVSLEQSFSAKLDKKNLVYFCKVKIEDSPYEWLEMYIYMEKKGKIRSLCYSGYDYRSCFYKDMNVLYESVLDNVSDEEISDDDLFDQIIDNYIDE